MLDQLKPLKVTIGEKKLSVVTLSDLVEVNIKITQLEANRLLDRLLDLEIIGERYVAIVRTTTPNIWQFKQGHYCPCCDGGTVH